MRLKILLSFFILWMSVLPPARAFSGPFDHSEWDRFLKTFVNDEGEVDYGAVQRDPSMLQAYLSKMESINELEVEANWPREERLALWLNLYHAGLVKLVIDHYPVKSLLSIPGGIHLPVAGLGETRSSLNSIRTDKLMSAFRDEKIHLALCMGARSGPRMRRDAFVGPKVEGQLFLATRDFVNDSSRNRIEPGEGKLIISRLFKWYAADFKLDFGFYDDAALFSDEENAIINFLAYYLEDAQKVALLEARDYKIKYMEFDWSLNDVSKGSPQAA